MKTSIVKSKNKSVPKPLVKLKGNGANDNNRANRPVIKKESIDPANLPVVDQAFLVFFGQSSSEKRKEIRRRIGAWFGFVFGGTMPLGSYGIAHFALTKEMSIEAVLTSKYTLLLIGLLSYSAPNVFSWAKDAFGANSKYGWLKAVGFTLGLEGLMIVDTSPHIYLQIMSYVCLGILIFINAVSSGCQLVLAKPKKEI